MTSLELRAAAPLGAPALPHARRALPAEYRPLLVALPIGVAILIGMSLDNGAVTLVAAIAALLAGLISPPVGLAVLAFMTPLKSPAVIPAPGFNTLLVGAILLGSVYRLPIERPTLRPGLPLLLLLGFTLYVGAQQLPELVAGYAGAEARRVGYLFIQLATVAGVALAAAAVLRGRPVMPFVAAGLMGAVIAAVLAIAVYVLPAGTVKNLVDISDATNRVVGPFGDPNYFGLFQATAIAACAALILVARSGALRWLVVATAIVLGLAFAIALSRAALVAVGAGIVALAFTRSRRAGIATIGGLAIATLVVYPIFLEWRLTADAGRASAQAFVALGRSDASRVAAALAGPQMWLTSPLFGVGFGQYPLLSGRFTGYPIESHNWYANILAEQGLVGVLLWLPMLAATLLQILRSTGAARSVGLAVFVTYAIGSIFLQPPLSVQTSAFAVIVVVAALTADWSRLSPATTPERLAREQAARSPNR